MSYLEIALANARKGYPIFPTQPENKRPKPGFNDWEGNATTDEELIRGWWAEKDWLPAIAPGRVGLAVIDVDQHEGKANGFESLDRLKVFLPDTFHRPSVSGNGVHHWYRGEVGSVNGVIPGVDRKAQGGYIVAVYELPDPSEIIQPIPERLSGSVSASVERKRKSTYQLNEWMEKVGAGEPGDEMYEELEHFKRSSGNSEMSKYVARVIAMAAGQSQREKYRGTRFPGATIILDLMMKWWMSLSHSSGDPEEEFMVNVRSAIEKFGDPVLQESLDDAFARAQRPPTFPFNEDARVRTIDLLRKFCTKEFPGWENTHTPAVNEILSSLSLEQETHTVEEYQAMVEKFMDRLRSALNG